MGTRRIVVAVDTASAIFQFLFNFFHSALLSAQSSRMFPKGAINNKYLSYCCGLFFL